MGTSAVPVAMAASAEEVHNRTVDQPESSRVLIEDQRGNGGFLRVTWHPDRKVLLVSHWRNDLCTATTIVGISDIPKLVSLLAAALADAATRHIAQSPSAERPAAGQVARVAGAWDTARRVLRRVLHPNAA
jgi:hypothetical protein